MEMQPFPLQPLSTHTAHLQCVAEVQQAGLALLQLAGMQPNSMQLVCNPLIVRRAGRKTLYMAGGVQMFTAQVATAVLMGVAFTGGRPVYRGDRRPGGVRVRVHDWLRVLSRATGLAGAPAQAQCPCCPTTRESQCAF